MGVCSATGVGRAAPGVGVPKMGMGRGSAVPRCWGPKDGGLQCHGVGYGGTRCWGPKDGDRMGVCSAQMLGRGAPGVGVPKWGRDGGLQCPKDGGLQCPPLGIVAPGVGVPKMATREGSWGHRAAPLLGQFKGTPMLGRLWEKRGCRPQSWVNLRVPRCWASFGVLGVQRCPKIGGGESLGVTAGQRRCPKLQDKDGVLETCGCWVNPGGQGGGLGLGWGPGVGVGVGCFLGWGALTGALAGRFGAVDGAGVELIEPRLQEGHGHGGRQPGQALPQRRALPAGTRGHGAGTPGCRDTATRRGRP